jgi:hypothetical protein
VTGSYSRASVPPIVRNGATITCGKISAIVRWISA